jgi:peptide chain release factor 2
MDNYEYNELLKQLKQKLSNITNILKPEKLHIRLDEIELLESDSGFWDDIKNATQIGKEKNKILGAIKKYNRANDALNDAFEMYEMSKEEGDEETMELLYEESSELENIIKSTEIEAMLSGTHDNSNAILSIHPGAGGTESNDWANMLYRMYLRWAEKKDFKVELLDFQAGDEVGVKDVSILIKGENAYGYLKVEMAYID